MSLSRGSPEPRDPETGSVFPAESWGLTEVQPTSLAVPWVEDDPPTLAGILAALEAALGSKLDVVDDGADMEADVLWEAHLQESGEESGLVVYCWVPPDWFLESIRHEGAQLCKWAVVVESSLDPEEPVLSYASLLRTAGGAIESAPLLMDLETRKCYRKEEIDDLLKYPDLILPEPDLWSVHAVYDEGKGSGGVWLHTHGLSRCGRIELEILDVPSSLTTAASQLLNVVGGLILDEAPPLPGDSLMIAHGTSVVLQPWRRVVAVQQRDNPGGMEDREPEDDGPHTGPRAVICAPRPEGRLRRRWVWPSDALEYVSRKDHVVRRSTAATERAARQARVLWPEFAMAFYTTRARQGVSSTHDGIKDAGIEFLAKVGFATDTYASDFSREHLWFSVQSIERGRGVGELLNNPIDIHKMRRGDRLGFDVEDLSDWIVVTPSGEYGPYRVSSLRRYLQESAGEG